MRYYYNTIFSSLFDIFDVFLLQDYPFFRQHKQTKGTITMDNGELAAVCLDCFDNLKNQSLEVTYTDGQKV